MIGPLSGTPTITNKGYSKFGGMQGGPGNVGNHRAAESRDSVPAVNGVVWARIPCMNAPGASIPICQCTRLSFM